MRANDRLVIYELNTERTLPSITATESYDQYTNRSEKEA